MHEVVVLSGKGGTGKTSVTASFSVLAAGNTIIADCDVDAANMHLLMDPKTQQQEAFYSGELAELDLASCISCGKCKESCHIDAISVIKDTYRINAFRCEGCGYCALICPTEAISMKARRSGDFFLSIARTGDPMAHARLDPGADNSGKLVAKVKTEAKKLAERYQRDFILVDGAPGIGCPVVSSLAGANYVALVTEPSASGLHDLKRLVEVLQKFRLKAGCIINKADLQPEQAEQIKAYCNEKNIDLLGSLPYDPAFTEAMIQGKTVVETSAALKQKISRIWE
ncbi:MAG: ATP-binding protein, partial [Bacteroidetes bacterium]|nr:ATP-binding protein [Bacteroidota bacterium]